MKLTRVEGPPVVLVCTGCKREGIGGTEEYPSAATGETKEPEAWYLDDTVPYCGECSAKLQEEDPTRSITQFYEDTAGKEIAAENL